MNYSDEEQKALHKIEIGTLCKIIMFRKNNE